MITIKSIPSSCLPIVVILAVLVSACGTRQDPAVQAEPQVAATPAVASEYDMNSWKTIIGDECRAFTDGCNNCFREPGKMAACTRKACSAYQQPRCLDEAAAAGSAARQVDYACDADKSFSISYHEFVQDDQHLKLRDSEIMLSDHQTRIIYRLQREPSASGEKYLDAAGFLFFAKGDEALVMEQDSRLYSGCTVKR